MIDLPTVLFNAAGRPVRRLLPSGNSSGTSYRAWFRDRDHHDSVSFQM